MKIKLIKWINAHPISFILISGSIAVLSISLTVILSFLALMYVIISIGNLIL